MDSSKQYKHFLNRVAVRIEQHMAYVTMTKPDKLNALDLDMLQALKDAARFLHKQKQVRVVILQGEGESFCAGLDFNSVIKEPPQRLLSKLLKVFRSRNLFQSCVLVWRDLPIPVIAVIQGHCLGGGLQIAMGADFRIAHPDTQFSIMESKWGLIPDMSGLVTFPDNMRQDHAKWLTMTADMIDAKQALEMGLVTSIDDDPSKLAAEWSEKLINRSPDALAITKKLFHRTWNNSSERSKLFWETIYQLRLLAGKNQKIAVSRETGKAKEYKNRSIK